MCGRRGPVCRTLFLWTNDDITFVASVSTISRIVQEYFKDHEDSFSPEELTALIVVFGKTWPAVRRNLDGDPKAARELFAKRIIETATASGVDETRLCTDALDYAARELLSLGGGRGCRGEGDRLERKVLNSGLKGHDNIRRLTTVRSEDEVDGMR
jgi:hypothetical protein